MQTAVSVIIPVHNGADYIEDTVSCIMKQTFQDMEIIIVDDGSTDETSQTVHMLQEQDSRISYIYQDKANAGVARNKGMQEAKGEYLLFLDGDDLFEPTLVEVMYNQIVKDEADVCVCDADQYDTGSGQYLSKPQYLRKKYLPEKIPFSRKEIGNAILYFTTSVPWNKMVRKTFIDEHQLYFQDIERANDQFFSIMTLVLAQRITIVDRVLVHYRINQKGNLTTEFSKTPLCAFEAMLATKEELERMSLLQDENVRCAFDNKVLNLMIYSLNIQRSIDAYKELYETLVNGGFEKLGMTVREETYYFNKLEYQNLKSFHELSYDQFLLMKNREYRDAIARKNAAYKDMVEQKNAVIEDLKEKEKELKAIKKKNWYKKITKWIARYHKLIGKEDEY